MIGRLLFLIGVAFLLGCADAGARVYEVTLTESSTIQCGYTVRGISDTTPFDEETSSAEKTWKADHEFFVQPQAAELHIVTTPDGVTAWFSQTVATGQSGIDEGGPDDVMTGPPEPDYVLATFEKIFRPFDYNKSNVLGICKAEIPVEEQLEVTLANGEIDGRLVIIENTYLSHGISECAATISCIRMLPLTGAELVGN